MRCHLLAFLLAGLIVSPAMAGSIERLRKVKTVPGLARYIYSLEDHLPPVAELVRGIDDPRTIQIKGYSVPIPIREVFGTIIEDCFDEKLPKDFKELGKGYGVREICSFRTSDDEIFRYHICIYDDRQYAMMKAYLLNLAQAEAQKCHTKLRPPRIPNR
ncbi:hypothetical protein [Mesoterricola silvestris]|uniref:hypothetical protein n=1 Tax=Mesoterricola silvestris TaxID=2927979 RepID=UPI002931A79E|nr:hypothetical protein [Mesoterricola silvestris]